jgi:hypothetical protein
MYRGTTKLEYEIYDHTGNNCCYRNSDKGSKRNSEALPGILSKNSLQKTATLGTSQIMREVQQAEN